MADKTVTKPKPKAQAKTTYKARLQVAYFDEYAKQLKEELGLKNIYEVPRLEKVVINVGLGKAKEDKKILDVAENTIKKITGQAPIRTISKGAIASFKLREGVAIGLKVTLRDSRMYEFADRLINLVLPRLRDFHGVNHKSFDKQANYSLGLIDQSVFPELSYEDTATPHGLQITFHVKSKSTDHSKALLEKLGMPFEKTNQSDSKEGA